MTTNSIETQSTKFEIDNGDSSFTEIKEVKSFSGFDGSASEIDATHLQSSAKEFKMGLQDFGNFNLDCNYLPSDAGQSALRAAKAGRTALDIKITFSDNSTASFAAYVLSANASGSVDALVESSFNLRITGDVAFA